MIVYDLLYQLVTVMQLTNLISNILYYLVFICISIKCIKLNWLICFLYFLGIIDQLANSVPHTFMLVLKKNQ